MTIIKWREGYNTGIEQFDQDHRQLVEMINGMYTIVRENENSSNVLVIVNDVKRYAETHFNSEEEALARTDYPDLDEHKLIHQKLSQSIEQYSKRLEAGERIEREFYTFLRQWLLEHIMEVDKKYSKYLS